MDYKRYIKLHHTKKLPWESIIEHLNEKVESLEAQRVPPEIYY